LRLVLLIFIPALILAALIGISRAAGTSHYVIDGAEGELLYAASFDGDSLDGFNDEWEQYQGRQDSQIVDGVMRLHLSESYDSLYSLTRRRFGDFDLRVQGRATAGPLDNGYGVIFRLQDRNNYYLFLVSSDGYYSVVRVLNGEYKELSTWIATTTPTPELEGLTVSTGLNVINEIRVLARGSTFEFYVNGLRAPLCIPNNPDGTSTYYEFFETPEERCVQGQIVSSLTDDSIPAGQLGVVVQSFEMPEGVFDLSVEFDNLLVYGA